MPSSVRTRSCQCLNVVIVLYSSVFNTRFVGDLSEHEMDNYLDFCERALLKTEDDKAGM